MKFHKHEINESEEKKEQCRQNDKNFTTSFKITIKFCAACVFILYFAECILRIVVGLYSFLCCYCCVYV